MTPEWTERLCRTPFGRTCEAHSGSNNSECVFFDVDAPGAPAKCAACVNGDPRCLRVRRYVYRDVIRCDDVARYLDVTDMQSYTINGYKVVFINPVRTHWDSVAHNACATCRKSLPRGLRYCSIWCKVSAGLPVRKRARKQRRPKRSVN